MSKSTKKSAAVKETTVAIPAQTLGASEIGALYKNEDAEINATMIGKVVLNEPGEYWMNAHAKRAEDKSVYLSLSGKVKNGEKSENVLLDDRGVLFKNNRKRLAHQPDYTGRIASNRAGEFTLHAVVMNSKDGTPYMDISIIDATVEPIAADDLPF